MQENELPEIPPALSRLTAYDEGPGDAMLMERGPVYTRPDLAGAIRLPQVGEFVIYQLPTEQIAMLGPSRIVLWKGTSVAQIIKSPKMMLQRTNHVATEFLFSVEVEGGEIITVTMSSASTAQNWIWNRV